MKEENKRWVSIQFSVALVKIGEPAIQPMIEVLKDENVCVRGCAAKVLGQIGGKTAVKPLIEALKDKKGRVRSAAAKALGEIGDKAAIKPLIDCLESEGIMVVVFRGQVADALHKITGQDFGEDYNKWLDWWKKNKDKFKDK